MTLTWISSRRPCATNSSTYSVQKGNCLDAVHPHLKARRLWVEPFATVEELRLALLACKDRNNCEWLIERHRRRAPAAVRAAFAADAAA